MADTCSTTTGSAAGGRRPRRSFPGGRWLATAAVLLLVGCGGPTTPAAPDPAPVPSDGDGTPAATPSPTPVPSASAAPSSPPVEVEPAVPSEPTSVAIPRIGLSEPITGFGLDQERRLLVPQDAEQVGWFSGGGRPGGPGPTVVYGHVDSFTGPAVFARLGELAPGDVARIGSADGSTTEYEVTEVQVVPQDAFPTEAVFGSTPTDTLRLITCTGLYDDDTGYADNLVVSAVPR